MRLLVQGIRDREKQFLKSQAGYETKPQTNHTMKTYKVYWPILADMPPSNHWPDRPAPFEWERSEVALFLAKLGVNKKTAQAIMGSASRSGTIVFQNGLWMGKKHLPKPVQESNAA